MPARHVLILRPYPRDADAAGPLFISEDAESGELKPFANAQELWDILQMRFKAQSGTRTRPRTADDGERDPTIPSEESP